ncbi:MAG: efflux RND transporter periplasmic adaptor subunit [Candidatus Margulisiibacteriota bacterium]|jgi:RND family efflux transporter MFP subunit
MKKTYLLYIGLILAALILSGCGNGKKEEVKPSKITPVETMVISPKSLTTTLELTAGIKALQQVQVVAKANGDIKQVLFNLGDKVRKDQVIARIDDELYQSNHEQALSNYQLAESSLQRVQTLYAKSLVSLQELEGAKARAAGAKAGYTAAKLGLEYTEIKSPIDGVVAAKLIEAQNSIAAGMPVATIMDVSQVKLTAGATEFDIAKIHNGSKVKIAIDSVPGEVFWGTVTAKGISSSPLDSTYPVEITADNPQSKLSPGMLAKIFIDKETFPAAILLPQDVILEREDGHCVFKLVGDKAVLVKVTLGETVGDLVQVTEGLRAGDVVIIKGQQNVVDGEQVQVSTGN